MLRDQKQSSAGRAADQALLGSNPRTGSGLLHLDPAEDLANTPTLADATGPPASEICLFLSPPQTQAVALCCWEPCPRLRVPFSCPTQEEMAALQTSIDDEC